MRNSVEVASAVPSEVARHKFLRARLLAEIPDLDEETLSDTLEGITDLREVLAEVLRTALDDEAIVQMEMLGHSFFVYLGLDGETKIIYKGDKGYGLLICE